MALFYFKTNRLKQAFFNTIPVAMAKFKDATYIFGPLNHGEAVKEDANLTLSSDTLDIAGASGSGFVTYSYDGDGNVTAVSSAPSVATVQISGSNITVTYVSAGTATITVSATGSLIYNDVSTTLEVTCSRSASTLNLSTSTLSISGAAGSGSFTFSYTGDGTISVSSSSTSVATVSRSGTTVTVTYVNAGSSTITVSLSNGTKYAATSKTCAVTCSRSNRTVTLSKTSVSLTAASSSTTLTITFTGDGNLNYASTNTGVATVSVNKRTTGATATITRKANGSCTVNFSLPQTNKWNASGNKGVSVSCSSGTVTWYVLHNDSWYGTATLTFQSTYGVAFSSLNGLASIAGTEPWTKNGVTIYIKDSGYQSDYPYIKMTNGNTEFLHSQNAPSSTYAVQKTSAPSNGATYYTFTSH